MVLASLLLSLKASAYDTTFVYGVTIDDISGLTNVVNALNRHDKKVTVRIVFDEWMPATYYQTAVNQIYDSSYIMGELLDSYVMSQYSLAQYVARSNEYLNLLGSKVYIWEIGNEINGEWLGSTSSVVAKMDTAYKIFKAAGKKTALTLYYNKDCWENPLNEMFRWVNTNVPAHMKTGLDYVWLSYWEDDCNGLQPNWQVVMDSVGKIFPNAKIGIGECGTSDTSKKTLYVNKYYGIQVNHPRYVGGCFWWYYKQDCVPYTKPLWTVINNAMNNVLLPVSGESEIEFPTQYKLFQNYPNPFNPGTFIRYQLPVSGSVSVKVYNVSGSEVRTLVQGIKSAGTHSAYFDGTALPSGIYFVRMQINGGKQYSSIKTMILLK